MSTTVPLLDQLRQLRLLESEQLDEVERSLQARFAEPKALAQELLRRDWLTAYQANLLLLGRGRELVLGSYVILEKLGEGGMGAVFKARHQMLGRTVALKLIRKDRITNPATVKRFRREIRAAAQLNHPNIVLAFDADEVHGSHFFTMEFVPGTDLHQLVKKDGPLPVAKACAYIQQAALGLQHAYECGMVHRDIKPHNLLRADQGEVIKILDMGLARMDECDNDATSMLTQEGAVMGTPDYIAPEQAHGAHTVDIRADLYSLGCTFYYLLTGQPPFPTGSLASKLLRHQLDEPTPVEQLRPDVPPAVAAVVRKLMAKKPEDRYQTPRELAEQLARLDQAPTVPAPAAPVAAPQAAAVPGTAPAARSQPTRASQVTRRQADRRRLMRFNAIGGGVLAVVAVALFLLLRSSTPEKPQPAPPPVVEPTPPDPGPVASGPGFQLPAASWPDRPPEIAFVLGEERGRHWGSIDVAAFSPDGKILATANGGQDNKVRFWDPATLEEKLKLQDSAYTTSMAFSPDGKRMATAYNPPQLWDLSGTPPVLVANLIKGGGTAVLGFTADSRYLVMSSSKSLQLLDGAAIPLPPPLILHENTGKGSVRGKMSQDGRSLAVWSDDEQTVRVWDLSYPRQPRLKATIPIPKPGPYLALAPDGKQLAVAATTTSLQLWDLSGSEARGPVAEEDIPTNALTGLAYSPDGKTLVRGRSSLGYQLLDVSGGKLDSAGRKYFGRVGGQPTFSPDGRTLVLVSGNALLPWDLSEPEPKELLPPPFISVVNTVAVSRDGQTLVMWGGQLLAAWDVASHTMKAAWGTNERVSMALHPDGKLLVTTGQDQISYYDTEAGKRTKGVRVPGNLRYSAFSPDGTLLAVSDDKGTVHLLDGASGEERQQLVGTPGPLAFSADGKLLAASRKVFEVTTGQEQCTLDGGGRVAFRPDGKMIATSGGGSQGSINLCDTATGKVIRGATPWGSCVTFSPDGRLLARSSSNDGGIYLIDPDSGKVVQKMTLPGPASHVVFTPDGQYLMTANANGTVYFLRVAPEPAP